MLLTTAITDQLADLLTACVRPSYYTDIGRNVMVGTLAAGETDAPCCLVIPGATRDRREDYALVDATRQIEIRGLLNASDYPDDSEHALVDQIAYDIRACIWSAPSALTDLVRDIRIVQDAPGYRESGGNIIGSGVTIEIDFAYTQSDPESPA